MKRIVFCLFLISLSIIAAQAQVKNRNRILQGQLEIQQNEKKVKPCYDVKEGVYYLNTSINSDTIELSLRSFHDTTMHVCMVYYDAHKNTIVWYKKMKTGDGYPYGITPEARGAREYMCFFYSIEELDIDAIVNTMNNNRGNLSDKLQAALGVNRMVSKEDIRFVMNKIEFSARTEKTVVPVIIEIVHE